MRVKNVNVTFAIFLMSIERTPHEGSFIEFNTIGKIICLV